VIALYLYRLKHKEPHQDRLSHSIFSTSTAIAMAVTFIFIHAVLFFDMQDYVNSVDDTLMISSATIVFCFIFSIVWIYLKHSFAKFSEDKFNSKLTNICWGQRKIEFVAISPIFLSFVLIFLFMLYI